MSNLNSDQVDGHQKPLIVILDANVLVHGKALVDLPWSELEHSIIEIVFVAPAVKELDKLKNESGRPNKIARQLSADMRAQIQASNHSVEVRKANPRVTKKIELSPCTRLMHPTLNLAHADQALINDALSLKCDGNDVLLLTDDTICYATAHGVGLPAKLLPVHWLREPEPDEVSKENAKIKEEVKRLKAMEPNISLNFHDDADQRLEEFNATITFWPALSEPEINVLMSEVQQQYPQATSFEQELLPSAGPFPSAAALMMAAFEAVLPRSVYEPATEKQIEHYKTNTYPNWLEAIRAALRFLHAELTSRTEWPSVRAVVCNIGTRAAADMLLRIRARGNFHIRYAEPRANEERNSEPSAWGPNLGEVRLPRPPRVPRGRVKTIDPYPHLSYLCRDFAEATPPLNPLLAMPWQDKRPDTFYWRAGQRDWVNLMELECASWRHGSPELGYRLQIRPYQSFDLKGAVELSVQANNISHLSIARLPTRITSKKGSTIDKARALINQLAVAVLVDEDP